MSSSGPAKFQDHYALLGVNPKADLETIKAAFTALVAKYKVEDPEKLEALNIAFEVLSDPDLRASFDAMKGVNKEEGTPKFNGEPLFKALRQAADLRSTMLCILYDRRRANPFKPGLTMRQVANMLQVTTEELNFALWYLKKRSFVTMDDKSSLEITVEGMDHLESNPPDPERVLHFFVPDAIAQKPVPTVITAPAPAAEKPPVRLMNRVVQVERRTPR
jgi:hypothetical protein